MGTDSMDLSRSQPTAIVSECGLAILSLTAGFAEDPASFPDVSKVGYEAVKKWADERVALAERDWTATGVKRQASPQHWSQLEYQIQVDRFNNGDPSNDELKHQG